jgi:type VI secretion system protein ImpL
MKQLSDIRNSPIRKLLEDASRNTRFESASFKGFKDKFERKVEKAMGNVITMHPVDRDFKDLQAFVGTDPDKKSDLDAVLEQLAQVSDELDALNSQTPKDAKNVAQNVLTNSGAIPQALKAVRSALKSRDDRTRRYVSALFEQPIRSSWRALLGRTMEYFTSQWSQEVIEPYRLLATYFPFDPTSKSDAPISEVAEIFSDNGKLWLFVDKELKPFEDEQWEPVKWEGVGLELSPAAKGALQQAKLVRTSLFRGADAGMKVEVRLDPPHRPEDARSVDKVCLVIGGQGKCLVVEDGKPASFAYDWPGDGGAALKLVREHGKTLGLFGSSSDETVEEKNFDGGWGLFKLVASATRVPSSSRADYRCRWTFSDGTAVTGVIRTDKGFNNPFAKSLSLSLPDRLN